MKDERTEQQLRDRGCIFTYAPSVPLGDIVEQTLSQSRMQLHEDYVQLLAALRRDGTEMNAVILYDDGKKPYVIGHGLHRVASARVAELETIDAYIVDHPTEAQRDAIGIGDNGTHGMRMSTKEQELAVIHLVLTQGSTTVGDAASLVGMAKARAQKLVNDESNRRKLREKNIADPDIEFIGPAATKALAGLHAPVVQQIVSDAKAAGSPRNISKVAKRAKKAETDEEALVIVRQEATTLAPERKATAGGRMKIPTHHSALIRALEKVIEANAELQAQTVKGLGEEMSTHYIELLTAASTAIATLKFAVEQGE